MGWPTRITPSWTSRATASRAPPCSCSIDALLAHDGVLEVHPRAIRSRRVSTDVCAYQIDTSGRRREPDDGNVLGHDRLDAPPLIDAGARSERHAALVEEPVHFGIPIARVIVARAPVEHRPQVGVRIRRPHR